jgi:hypothetical protein
MMRFIRPRLRMPVRIAVLGAVAAAVFAVGPGPRTLGITFAIITAGIAAGYAIAAYVRAGEDSDLGAIYGSRADERQKLISLQARGLAQCHSVSVLAVMILAWRELGRSGPGVRTWRIMWRWAC